MDKAAAFLVWSPCASLVSFNPVITPTASVLPLTPFIATPMPYFVFSPHNENLGHVGHQQSAITYQNPSFFAQTPLLQPAPGSKESSTPRKRHRRPSPAHVDFSPSVKKMRAMTSSITTDEIQVSNRPESPSYPERFALDEDDLQIRPDPHAAATSFEQLSINEKGKPYLKQFLAPKMVKIEPEESKEPISIEEWVGVKMGENNVHRPEVYTEPGSIEDTCSESPSDQDWDSSTPKKTRRQRTLKHIKLNGSDNWMDKALVSGGINSPILVNRSYSCPECSKTYRLRKHCRRHMVSHTDLKPFSCDKCDTGFNRQDSWRRHRDRCCR